MESIGATYLLRELHMIKHLCVYLEVTTDAATY